MSLKMLFPYPFVVTFFGFGVKEHWSSYLLSIRSFPDQDVLSIARTWRVPTQISLPAPIAYLENADENPIWKFNLRSSLHLKHHEPRNFKPNAFKYCPGSELSNSGFYSLIMICFTLSALCSAPSEGKMDIQTLNWRSSARAIRAQTWPSYNSYSTPPRTIVFTISPRLTLTAQLQNANQPRYSHPLIATLSKPPTYFIPRSL